MALQRAHPALLGQDDGDRLALDEGLDGDVDRRRARRRSSVRRLPSGVRAELLARLARAPPRSRSTAQLLAAEQRLQLLPLLASELLCSLRISISSSLRRLRRRMLRMASACISVSVNALDQRRLGLVLVADDADHLVEVEDRRSDSRRGFRAGARSLPGGGWSGAPAPRGGGRARRCSTSLRPITRGRAVASSTFMLSGKRRFQLGQPEQRLHQHFGLDAAASSAPARGGCPRRSRRARRRAAAASCRSISSAICSISSRLLHLVGDLGDDDLPGAALALLRPPICARRRKPPRPVS